MTYTRIDHLILGVASLEQAALPFERLGLRLTPPTRHAGRGTQNRVFFVGSGADEFYVELLAITDDDEARGANSDRFVQAVARGGAIGITLNTLDMDTTLAGLAQRGVVATATAVTASDGRTLGTSAPLDVAHGALLDVRMIQYPESLPDRTARHAAAGLFNHGFPLTRLDHLAAIAPDLEAATRFWGETLGVPVAGEVRTPAMIIRQLRIGDAVLELLGPATPDSPVAARPPGLVSMAAFEVPDLEAAVQQARTAGFTVSDPNTGALPGTRTATIPAAEMSGVAMQLLQYV